MKSLLFSLLPFLSFGQLVFDPGQRFQTFENQYAFYLDSTNALSVNELLSVSRHFTVIESPSAHFGRNLNTHWLKMPIRNSGNTKVKLYIQNSHPFIDNLALFQVTKGQVVKQAAFDYEAKRKEGLVKEVARPTFRIELEPGEETDVYAQFRNSAGTLIFDVKLLSEEAFLMETLTEERIYNVLLGTLMAFSVLAFCYFIISKSAIYLFYSLYVLLINVAIQGQTGRLYNMLDFKMDFFNGDSSFRYYGSLALIANILFLKELFGEKPWKGTYKFISLILLSLAVFINILTLFDWGFIYYKVNSIINVYTLFTGVFLLNLLYFINKHKKAYRLYVFSFAPLLILLAYRLLTLANVLPTPVNFSHFSPPALALESLILLVGLSKSFIQQLLEKNRLEKQLKVIHIETQESERKKIAADLHDDLGSTLAVLKDRIESGSEESIHIIQKAIKDLRSISQQLMPHEFELLGFKKSLEQFADESNRQNTRPHITLIFFGNPSVLPMEKELNVYRILTELVHNTRKHSSATEISIELTYRPDALYVSFAELDGESAHTSPGTGIGLKSIDSRLQYLNAVVLENGFTPTGFNLIFEVYH